MKLFRLPNCSLGQVKAEYISYKHVGALLAHRVDTLEVSLGGANWPRLGRQVEREPPQECQLDFKTRRKQKNVDV